VYLIRRYETETLNQLRHCAVLTVKLCDTQHTVSIVGQKRKLTPTLRIVFPLKLMKTLHYNGYLCNKIYAIYVIFFQNNPREIALI
jgi:hypothetical protein